MDVILCLCKQGVPDNDYNVLARGAMMKNSVKTILWLPIIGLGLLFGVTTSAATPTANEVAKLLASDAAGMDVFGRSVAINGDTAVVGAFEKGRRFGAAYVFTRSGGVWNEQQKLTASDGTDGDAFGISVAVDGDTAVICATGDDDKGSSSGSAYVFTRSGGVWTEQAKLTASDGARDDVFGVSVSVDGNTVLIGAYLDDDLGTQSGSVYAYTRSGGVWNEQQKLTASGGGNYDGFGFSLAVDGDTAVIGNRKLYGTGSAYVFTRSGGVWNEQQKLTASDGTDGDVFGISVAVDGDAAVIGAHLDDDNGSGSGSAYVFTRSGGVWTEQAKLTASDGAGAYLFGGSVAIDENTVLIGASEGGGGLGSGKAYVFTRSAGGWSETLKLLASDGQSGDWLGKAVGLSDSTAIISAEFHDFAGLTNAGAAYVFNAELPISNTEVIDSYFGMNFVTGTEQVPEVQLLEITYNGGSSQNTQAIPAFPGFSAISRAPFSGMPDGIGLSDVPSYTSAAGGDGETTRTIGRALPIDWDTSGAYPKIEITEIRIDVSGIGEWTARFTTPYVVGLIPSVASGTDTELESDLSAPQGDLYGTLRGTPGNPLGKVIAATSPPGLESLIGQAFGDFIFSAARVDDNLWQSHDSGTNVALYDIWGAGPQDVFAVGANGTIVNYDGLSWSVQPSNTTDHLYSVWGSGGNDVFAVGANGTIVHYDGTSWAVQPSGTLGHLSSVWGSAPNKVFAVGGEGQNGIILGYDGSTWSMVDSFLNPPSFTSIWGSDSNNVFTVGYGGTKQVVSGGAVFDIPVSKIFKSNDGGATWAPFLDAWYDYLSGLWGSGPANLFTVGASWTDSPPVGVIYHYEGAEWASAYPPTPGLESMWFQDIWGTASGELFTVGDAGTILRNEGSGWASEVSGTTQGLFGIWGTCPADVFAVGANGTILQSKRPLQSCTQQRMLFKMDGIKRAIPEKYRDKP
jgi:hypothetical protein